ncbi:CCA tRNA nucleotidyltransferase [Cytobacillus sp. IB215665]|uniref:CCA tRNA nucleotidyltransferase n=1 Tax=Cytobacillus sp. IB215665 TaxID=3097357 RepID=UPI002A0B32C8|nr:CCA tRNA nucleotidyltransferase [Cytobacillus sp. IB215665]MDX8366461.1 CCA tRNA nucleotidyltransferase [Cytobacillus sp. IB215665]
MLHDPFELPTYIIQTIQQAGFEAYFVGGAVRDMLLHREIGDVDIATSALPQQVIELFPKTIDVGIRHGTVVILHKGESFEVTTFRNEGDYEEHRRPKDVTFISSLSEDLQRRDFTINAIAMTAYGDLIDPFDGQADIQKQMIRCVGDATERFNEDGLRMLRAIRFVSQLSFFLSDDTKAGISRCNNILKHISVERITAEFEKIMRGNNSHIAFQLLAELKIYKFLPHCANKQSEFEQLAKYKWHLLQKNEEFWTLFTMLLKVETPGNFLRSWKLPVKIIRSVEINIHYYNMLLASEWTMTTLYQCGLEHAEQVERIRAVIHQNDGIERLHNIKKMYASLPIISRKQLAVNGNDLQAWFNKKPGPWLKEYINNIEMAIVNGEVENEVENIKEWLLHCNLKLENNC